VAKIQSIDSLVKVRGQSPSSQLNDASG